MEPEPPKADPPKRKRRWYQFSLRSLMIGVAWLAVPCWWVTAQKKLVDDRRAMLARIEKIYHGHWYTEQLPPDTPSAVPALRRLLGDQGVSVVVLPIEVDAEIYPVIRALFPEVRLQIIEQF